MLGYLWLALRQLIQELGPDVSVRQMVLYVGRDSMNMPNRPGILDVIDGPGIAFHFDMINARELQPGALLASDHPCDIIMAFFAATDDIKARVRAVVNRLAARLADDPPRLKDALVRLTLLAPLRKAEPIVIEEINSMPITIDLETHPFASKFFLKGMSEGMAEGEARGKADTLLRQLRRRFQTLPSQIEDRVRAADIDQLDEWSERFADGLSLA